MKKKNVEKKNIFRMIFSGTLALCMLCITGCRYSDGEMGKTENKVYFSKMSEDEKEQYVLDYLSEKDGLRDAEILVMKKRDLGVMQGTEENTFVQIQAEPNNQFNLWVTDEGDVYDTYFTLDLRETMNLRLQAIYEQEFPNCRVYDNFRFCEPSSKEWNADDDLELMLKEEDIVHTIMLFVPEEDRKDDDQIRLEGLKEQLDIYDGNTNLYYCDDIEAVDYTEIDPNNYDLEILN